MQQVPRTGCGRRVGIEFPSVASSRTASSVSIMERICGAGYVQDHAIVSNPSLAIVVGVYKRLISAEALDDMNC